MRNEEVAKAFVSGAIKGKNDTGSLWISGGSLYSYRTKIAERRSQVDAPDQTSAFAVSIEGYSNTTRRQKSHLLQILHAAGYKPTQERDRVEVHNPGRHNGLGLAWGPEYSYVEFVIYRKEV